MEYIDKLNIALVIDSYYPMIDGVITVVDKYARVMKDVANVTVICPECSRKDYKDNFPYEVIRCKSVKVPFVGYDCACPKNDKKLFKKMDKKKFDIIHIHSPFYLGEEILKYAEKNNIPTIITAHSQYKQDFKRAVKFNFIVNMMLKHIMKTFNGAYEPWVVNVATAEIFKSYGLKKEPKIMCNATDMLPYEGSVEDIEQEYNLQNKKVLLFVGRLIKNKGIFFILESLRELHKKRNDFTMIYVGNGACEIELKQRIKLFNLEDNVILTGKISDREKLSKLYKRSDLFLFPSWYDTDGLVKFEAASQKTPTMFIEGIAACKGLKDKENCFISKHDKISYADYIDKVIDDKNLISSVGENAFDTIYTNWGIAIEKALIEYNKVIEKYNEEKLNV